MRRQFDVAPFQLGSTDRRSIPTGRAVSALPEKIFSFCGIKLIVVYCLKSVCTSIGSVSVAHLPCASHRVGRADSERPPLSYMVDRRVVQVD